MKALLIIDIQNDYFPGGKMELCGSEAAGAAAGRLLADCRKKALPIIHIQHISARPEAGFFLPGTVGAEINACVAPLPGEKVIVKHYPSSFRDTELLPHLRDLGVKELIVAGMMTHMCVDTTVRAAFDLGFSCVLAHDACATRDLAFNGAAVAAKDVQAAYMAGLGGIFARVMLVEEICAL